MQRTAYFIDGFSSHDHEVITIVNNFGLRKLFSNSLVVAVKHVHGDPGDGVRIPAVSYQRFGEGFDGLAAATFGDEEQMMGGRVQEHRDILTSFTRTGFVQTDRRDLTPVDHGMGGIDQSSDVSP